jgi:predicted nucleic acid-binding protein
VVLDAGNITNGQRIVVTRKYSDVIAATAVKSGAKGNRLKSELLKPILTAKNNITLCIPFRL